MLIVSIVIIIYSKAAKWNRKKLRYKISFRCEAKINIWIWNHLRKIYANSLSNHNRLLKCTFEFGGWKVDVIHIPAVCSTKKSLFGRVTVCCLLFVSFDAIFFFLLHVVWPYVCFIFMIISFPFHQSRIVAHLLFNLK